MGAWDYGLFQSDHDFDVISELDDEIGLYKLQKEAEAKAGLDSNSDEDMQRSKFYYTLHHPSDLEVVREFLNTPNVATGISPLQEALSKWQREADFGERVPFRHPGYIFVLLGACAMELGCQLYDETLAAMQVHFTESGFMPDALVQLDAALNGPARYKGQPYPFDSPDSIETTNRSSESGGSGGSGGWIGMNVPVPHGLFRGPDDTKLIAKIKARMAAYKSEKENYAVCGAAACEATKNKADGCLLVCSKCKERKYCSRECQMDHWKLHKLVCVKAA